MFTKYALNALAIDFLSFRILPLWRNSDDSFEHFDLLITCLSYFKLFLFAIYIYIYIYIYNRPPFRMEYRQLSKMRGTKKLLWNWNISIFQQLMDCLIYNNMQSCNKQWNTLPQLWNLLISIFHSSMEFHGILWTRHKFHGIPWNFSMSKGKFHGIPWNLMPTPNSMEFHGIARPKTKVPWNSMEFQKFHGIRLYNQIPWNSMESPYLVEKFHGIPWNYGSYMERGVTRNSMEL